jgi:hypothetical protein
VTCGEQIRMWKETGKPIRYSNQATGRKTEEAGFDSREKQEIHVFSKASRPPVGSQLTSHSEISGNFFL